MSTRVDKAKALFQQEHKLMVAALKLRFDGFKEVFTLLSVDKGICLCTNFTSNKLTKLCMYCILWGKLKF